MASSDDILNELHKIYVRQAEMNDNLAEMLGLLSERLGDSISSLAIEDMAKGEPKITSKSYGKPLDFSQIDAALDAHGYAHRRAAELAMDGWQHSVEVLKRANGGGG